MSDSSISEQLCPRSAYIPVRGTLSMPISVAEETLAAPSVPAVHAIVPFGPTVGNVCPP